MWKAVAEERDNQSPRVFWQSFADHLPFNYQDHRDSLSSPSCQWTLALLRRLSHSHWSARYSSYSMDREVIPNVHKLNSFLVAIHHTPPIIRVLLGAGCRWCIALRFWALNTHSYECIDPEHYIFWSVCLNQKVLYFGADCNVQYCTIFIWWNGLAIVKFLVVKKTKKAATTPYCTRY